MKDKETRQKAVIGKLCSKIGISYNEKTYQNIKLLLETYRDYDQSMPFYDFTIFGTIPGAEIIRLLVIAFRKRSPITEKEVDKIVTCFVNTPGYKEIMVNATDKLNMFGSGFGKLYAGIVSRLYLNDMFPVSKEIVVDFELTNSSYAYRKKEAVMLFGMLIYREMLAEFKVTLKDVENMKSEHMVKT